MPDFLHPERLYYSAQFSETLGQVVNHKYLNATTEFGLFAQEIYDCIELGRNQLNDFDRDLKLLSGELKTAFSHEQGLADRCSALVPAVPDGLGRPAPLIWSTTTPRCRAPQPRSALARAVHKKVGQALGAQRVRDRQRQPALQRQAPRLAL